MSTSPGSSAAPPRSTTSAPSGAATPESTATMVPPSITTSGSGIRAEPVPSNSHAARRAVSRPRSVTVGAVMPPPSPRGGPGVTRRNTYVRYSFPARPPGTLPAAHRLREVHPLIRRGARPAWRRKQPLLTEHQPCGPEPGGRRRLAQRPAKMRPAPRPEPPGLLRRCGGTRYGGAAVRRYGGTAVRRHGGTQARERTPVTLAPPAPKHTAWMPQPCSWDDMAGTSTPYPPSRTGTAARDHRSQQCPGNARASGVAVRASSGAPARTCQPG